MKLQHLAIVFVIIILPISMVISQYIQTQIDTISLQTQYNNKLQTATHDAIKAFQLNTLNNKYSTLSDSKIRDIEASISTFYNSLGTELGASGYDQESLQQFIPAIVYTMYDGYYIYGKYQNEKEGKYQYGLKPYIYYSCRYRNESGTYDFVVNYTLDNSITVFGKINGTYVTKSGTLIDPDSVQINGDTVIYNDITIDSEILEEQLVTLSDSGNPDKQTYQYTVYNNQKIYYDKNKTDSIPYFRYVNNKKEYITDSSANNEELNFLRNSMSNGNLICNSAKEYYKNAKKFSDWVQKNLKGITQENAVDSQGNKVKFAINTETAEIFKLSEDNDPLLDSSTFNQNRISVIRNTIQTTLNTAIANYSSNANYEFAMPIFTEEDWDKLENNIAVAVFMQGIPIGSKYYNNYCIITNNQNKEVVTKDSIYVITEDGEAHTPASKDVIDNGKNVVAAYKNISYEAQTVVGNETYTYYPRVDSKCYECIVNAAQTYSIDDVIEGKSINNKNIKDSSLRKIYLTALARERQNLYKTNGYFGI